MYFQLWFNFSHVCFNAYLLFFVCWSCLTNSIEVASQCFLSYGTVVAIIQFVGILWSFPLQPCGCRVVWDSITLLFSLQFVENPHQWLEYSFFIPSHIFLCSLYSSEVRKLGRKKWVAEELSALLPLGWELTSTKVKKSDLASFLASFPAFPLR